MLSQKELEVNSEPKMAAQSCCSAAELARRREELRQTGVQKLRAQLQVHPECKTVDHGTTSQMKVQWIRLVAQCVCWGGTATSVPGLQNAKSCLYC